MTILVLNKFHKANMENIGVPADKIKTFFNPISFIEKIILLTIKKQLCSLCRKVD